MEMIALDYTTAVGSILRVVDEEISHVGLRIVLAKGYRVVRTTAPDTRTPLPRNWWFCDYYKN